MPRTAATPRTPVVPSRGIDHPGPAGVQARFVPPEHHNPEQAAAWAISAEPVGEVAARHTILRGLPVYNYDVPSTLTAWVDQLRAPGLAMDPPATGEGLLGGRELIVLEAHGGGYGAGTPCEGWGHAWARGLALSGSGPRFIVFELTLWSAAHTLVTRAQTQGALCFRWARDSVGEPMERHRTDPMEGSQRCCSS